MGTVRNLMKETFIFFQEKLVCGEIFDAVCLIDEII